MPSVASPSTAVPPPSSIPQAAHPDPRGSVLLHPSTHTARFQMSPPAPPLKNILEVRFHPEIPPAPYAPKSRRDSPASHSSFHLDAVTHTRSPDHCPLNLSHRS